MALSKSRNSERVLILLAGFTLALSTAGPAFSKGKPPPPPEPEPPACEGLTNDFDLDQDGFPDLIDCQGLATNNGAEFDYPGCATAPSTAPNCTTHGLADVFAEVHRDSASTGTSGYDELAITDDEVFSFAEASLSLNIHVLPAGTLAQDRLVLTHASGTQAGVFLKEDRSFFTAGDCDGPPQITGFSRLSNPNEYGVFEVYTKAIFFKIDCIGGDAAQKRQHLLNTSVHEFGHGAIRQAPDPDSHHQQTIGDWIMEASLEPDRRDRLTIPTSFAPNTEATILSGTTTKGPTLCGDVAPFDGNDSTFDCLPAAAAP